MGPYKSTRDIAREAVEDEVKRAGRGKRKRNVDSSDDDDGETAANKNKKHERRNERSRGDTINNTKSNEPSELARLAGKYRDRAKERQDGILPSDENLDVDLTRTSGSRSTDDEIFDSVVAAVESGDRQALNRITTSAKSATRGGMIPETSKDAVTWLVNTRNVPKTAFGREICDYLRKKYIPQKKRSIPVSAAGRTVQKSVLTFAQAIHADPRDRERSWERPSEQTFATETTTTTTMDHHTGGHNDRQDFVIPKASVVCQAELLQKIQDCLDQRDRRTEKTNVTHHIKTTNPTERDDDDDDDIFASVGEYIPDNDDDDDDHINDMSAPKIHNPKSIFGDQSTTAERPGQLPLDPAVWKIKSSSSLVPQSLQGLSAVDGYGNDDDDGIALDFDGPMDDDDDHNEEADHTMGKKLTKKRGRKK